MRVAEGNVGDRDLRSDRCLVRSSIRNGDRGVGERGAADGTEELHVEGKPAFGSGQLCNGAGRLQFALLGALAVAEV